MITERKSSMRLFANVEPRALHLCFLQMPKGNPSHAAAVAFGITAGADDKIPGHVVIYWQRRGFESRPRPLRPAASWVEPSGPSRVTMERRAGYSAFMSVWKAQCQSFPSFFQMEAAFIFPDASLPSSVP